MHPVAPPALVALVLLGLACSGCGGPMGSARQAFDEGRYPDAAEALRRLEPEVGSWSAHDQGRYALTRGLTHLACGDARQAYLWLGNARARAREHPGMFDSAERGRLASAWRSLGLMPAEQ